MEYHFHAICGSAGTVFQAYRRETNNIESGKKRQEYRTGQASHFFSPPLERAHSFVIISVVSSYSCPDRGLPHSSFMTSLVTEACSCTRHAKTFQFCDIFHDQVCHAERVF